MQKTMAIKIIGKSSIKCDKTIKQVAAERMIMSTFNSKFITTLHYAFQTDVHIYLVMELAEGGDIRSLLSRFPDNYMT